MKIKTLLIAAVMGLGAQAASAEQINGAGSSFIYPVLSKWASTYYQETQEKINYQSIGSGGGIQQIIQGTVHFAATDAPLTGKELAEHKLIQFPVIVGGVIPTHNISGIKSNELRLDGETLALVFAGKVAHWDDPRIKALNPTLNLPHQAVTVVHRADGSGSTWMFTNYLSKVSPEWAKTIGSDKSVNWPKGVGGKGNEGVANYVKRLQGAIGYVELAYVLHNNMNSIRLKNQAGNFIEPTLDSLKAAAANADWDGTEGMAVVLTEQPGEQSWPITGATFGLMPITSPGTLRKDIQAFFSWGWRKGAQQASDLAYVPLPMNVVEKIEINWQDQ
ncbi:Phosphate-binding periplasmic protein [gamma proteobacterium HdN1]|nr:Phosphate-binding periplasmic protein [gamma proteobacterium HdN1]